MITPSFIEFKTADGLTLPGLLYKPKNTKKVAIYLHGNGSASVFYDENKKRDLPETLAKKNVALLKFNNRGAHIIKKLNVEIDEKTERKKYGMGFELIKECLLDIDAAISFLEEEGFNEFSLIGSSTGTNKICVYNFYKPKNKITKYILLAGGDDTGIYYDLLGKQKFSKLLTKAQEKIKVGEGEDIITDNTLFPNDIFSYKSFYDLANPDGDYNCFPYFEAINNIKLSKKPLFRYYKSIKKPTLVVYGGGDEYVWGDIFRIIDILKVYQPNFLYKVILDADHGFTNHQKELSEGIASWL